MGLHEDNTDRHPNWELPPDPDLSPQPLSKSTHISRPPDRYGFSLLISCFFFFLYLPSLNTYWQAVRHECWQHAMKEELDALQKNHAWDCSMSFCANPIGCKWVFSIKLWSNGLLYLHKAKLVALSNKQEYDIDNDETFVIAKMTMAQT